MASLLFVFIDERGEQLTCFLVRARSTYVDHRRRRKPNNTNTTVSKRKEATKKQDAVPSFARSCRRPHCGRLIALRECVRCASQLSRLTCIANDSDLHEHR